MKNTPDEKDPGGRLALARAALNMTQSDLCERVTGISLSTLKGYEAGRTEPGAESLRQLFAAGINPMWVIAGIKPMLTDDAVPVATKEHVRQALDAVVGIRSQLESLSGNPLFFPPDSSAATELKEILERTDNVISRVRSTPKA